MCCSTALYYIAPPFFEHRESNVIICDLRAEGDVFAFRVPCVDEGL